MPFLSLHGKWLSDVHLVYGDSVITRTKTEQKVYVYVHDILKEPS